MNHLARKQQTFYRTRRRWATGGVAFLAAMVAFHVIFGANGIFVFEKKRSEYRRLDQELRSLEEENARLNQRIRALRTDPKTIEKEAREQLRYARPGEQIFAVPETAPPPQVRAAGQH